MAYHKTLKNLFSELQNTAREVMAEDVLPVVKKAQSDAVKSEVYDTYTPFEYERRGDNGGLSDERNMVASFYTISGGVEMLVQNITKGSNQNMYIAPLVSYGHNNGYGEYMYPYNRAGTQDQFLNPRPFMHVAVRNLQSSLAHIEAMKRGLKAKGIDTY